MLNVMTKVIPKLPANEKFSLSDQMRRSCKAPLAILAEGYAKKHYRKDWLKYINDAIGECNEMVTHLSISRDLYFENSGRILINELIGEYAVCSKQLYRLGESWSQKK